MPYKLLVFVLVICEILTLLTPKTRGIFLGNHGYINIRDLSQSDSVMIRMALLNLDVSKNEKIINATFQTKYNGDIYSFYCGSYNDFFTMNRIAVHESQWIIPIKKTDESLVSLFLNKGVICKIATKHHLFPFKIYTGNHLPNMKQVFFEGKDETILDNQYHIWIQFTVALLALSNICICLIVFCACQLSKSV